jgi:hypothetical protein
MYNPFIGGGHFQNVGPNVVISHPRPFLLGIPHLGALPPHNSLCGKLKLILGKF